MKKLFIVLAVGIGLAACGDNTQSTPGGSMDSNITTPVPDDATNQADTGAASSDTGTIMDLNNNNDRPDGSSSGEPGSSTNSENSGSATDDNQGSN